MVLAIPGGTRLFSVLQNVLRQKNEQGTKVRLSTTVHEVLEDFQWLASDLARRPKRILEVVTGLLSCNMGTQDSTKPDMGGVHFVPL
jgi:hypothetical protein